MISVLTAHARVDGRTKNLIPRLKAGEIAIIDHTDLDGLSASGLVERSPAAVINASASMSGRYPNRGPGIVLQAGIPLIDLHAPGIMTAIRDGDMVSIEDGTVRCGGQVFSGVEWTRDQLQDALAKARACLDVELEAFARNTLEYLQRERNLVLEPLEIPDIRTVMAHRHAVVVVRGEGFKRDLEAILPYLRDMRPVLIAVDGGADALIEQGLKPDLIVGDMDSVSDKALRCGAEIVVHCYCSEASTRHANGHQVSDDGGLPGAPGPALVGDPDRNGLSPGVCPVPLQVNPSQAPGLARLQSLGVDGKLFQVAGTSEDMAMLLAYEKGADLIVAVGAHFGMEDFLDKGRAGMASTFLTRLRVGSRLVDARGVGALYPTGPGIGYAWRLLIAAALLPTLAMVILSPGLRATLSLGYIVFRHWLRLHGL